MQQQSASILNAHVLGPATCYLDGDAFRCSVPERLSLHRIVLDLNLMMIRADRFLYWLLAGLAAGLFHGKHEALDRFCFRSQNLRMSLPSPISIDRII